MPKTPKFHWVTTRSYVRVVGLHPLSVRVKDKTPLFWQEFHQNTALRGGNTTLSGRNTALFIWDGIHVK